MIGTPNTGSPAAETNNACAPAIFDLRPGANATRAQMNPNVKYYTIAGDWTPAIQGNPICLSEDPQILLHFKSWQ
jgi:hypothetical protein